MRFLFATDGSPGADVALDFLLALPLTSADHVTALTVPTYSFVGTDRLDTARAASLLRRGDDAARAVAEGARSRVTGRGIPATVDVRTGPVAKAAEQAALEHACDLILIGSRGLGAFTGSLLGSVARELARHSAIPVLVVRDRREAPRRVLVAVDGSDDAEVAVSLLARLPLVADASITLLHVVSERVEPRRADDTASLIELRIALREAEERAGALVVEQAAALLRNHAIDHEIAERGRVAEQILAHAAGSGVDLIVLGSRGQTHSGRPLQGSVADRVLSHAHCAVLVAKAPTVPRRVTERVLVPGRAVLAL